MPRSILLVALLGLLAAPLTHAEEPSVCTSMCESDKQQCTKRASKLTELDKLPTLEEKNPFARTSNQTGPVWSQAERATERRAGQMRNRERVEACNAGYLRCTRGCAPAVAPVVHRASGEITASPAHRFGALSGSEDGVGLLLL